MSTHNLCFLSNHNLCFLSESFHFLEVKFSIHLNRCVFVMNSDAAPNYKYMIGPHRSSLPHLWNITVKHNRRTNAVMKQNKQLNGDLKQEHKKLKAMTVRRKPSQADWGGSRHLVWIWYSISTFSKSSKYRDDLIILTWFSWERDNIKFLS